MSVSPSQNVFSLIKATLDILNEYWIFFISEPCRKLAIDDVTWQWFLQPTCLLQGKKILPLFHLVVSSNISLFSPLKTKALSHEHADFYISPLLSNIQALLVSNFQRTFSLHENPPRHIIIPVSQLSATSLLRLCGQSCTRFFQLRFQHWECGIDPYTITLTCCKAVPTVPGPLCFEADCHRNTAVLWQSVFPVASSTFAVFI